MMKPRLSLWAVCVLYALMGVVVVQSVAQPSACSALVTRALQAVGVNCEGMGRNTACYGFDRVDARFATTITEAAFSKPADTTPLVTLADLRTYPLELDAERWGIAVMNVQANVPNTLPGQAVTFLLLGDTQVQNDVPADSALTVTDPVRVLVTAGQRVNLRGGPGTNFNVAGTADPGQPFDADARSADGQWVRLAGFNAWLSRSLVSVISAGADLNSLPVADLDARSPMQAFYFRTGVGVPTCAEAPDVLVVQGPQEVRVRLSVNGAEVELGSTAVLHSATQTFGSLSGSTAFGDLVAGFDPAGDPTCLATEISLLEGDAVVNEGRAHVPLGHRTRSVTCLNAEGVPVFNSPWDDAEPLNEDELAALAFVERLPLPRAVTLPTADEVADSIARGPNIKPTPTRLPPVALPTRVAPTADPNRPQATTPARDATSVAPSGPSCDTFAVNGPFGPVGQFATFSWNQARGDVYGYQITVRAMDDDEVYMRTVRLYRAGYTESQFTLDVYKYFNEVDFFGNAIQWKVQVLVPDNAGGLTTLCESQFYVTQVDG